MVSIRNIKKQVMAYLEEFRGRLVNARDKFSLDANAIS